MLMLRTHCLAGTSRILVFSSSKVKTGYGCSDAADHFSVWNMKENLEKKWNDFCEGSDLFIRLSWHNSNKRVTLLFKPCGSYSVMVMWYPFYGLGFWFESHLANFGLFFFFRLSFCFFLYFFPAYILHLRVRLDRQF